MNPLTMPHCFRRPAVEVLETRAVPAVSSLFQASSGQLTVTGDAAADRITLSSNSAGNILLNGATISGAKLTTVKALAVNAGAGNDTVDLSNLKNFKGSVVVDGGLGNDTLTGSPGNDGIQGNVGDDVINAGAGNDTIYAYYGNDNVSGGDGDDWMHGDFDNDTLDGGLGNDTLYGGYGNDAMQGNYGNDLMDGQYGQDTLYAYYGNDTLFGGDGNDWMHGDFDNDLCEAGAGNDTVYGGLGNDFVHGQDGVDFVSGGPGNDVVTGAEGNDWLQGDEGDDTLYGFTGDDALIGGDGNDALYGEYDNDRLDGGPGNDGLFGGYGYDTLTGGPGADRFLDYTWTEKILFWTNRRWQDGITDANWRDDAHIGFENSGKGARNFAPASWNDVDVQTVDSALAVLHRATNGPRLLKRTNGADAIFIRYGAPDGKDEGLAGWNSSRDGTISMTDHAFSGGLDFARHVTFHEFGHYWYHKDTAGWEALSGWTRQDKSRDRWYSRGTDPDERWFYLSSALFVSDYARFNPNEDFADSFSKYFMNLGGFAEFFPLAFPGNVQWVQGKKAFLDRMVAALAS